MPRKTLLLLFILLTGTLSVHAQTFYRWSEWGVAAGGTQYFGDLNDQYGFHTIKPNVGIFYRYNLNHYLAAKFCANYTRVGYDDSYNDNAFQKLRNLSFKSNILEVTAQAEFNFFRFATGEIESEWTPYITCGVGAFYYNPYATYQGEKYFLRKLGTEGQNLGGEYASRKYSNFALCFPVGVGIKWWAVPGVNVGLEISDRLTTTDYLDDVSTTYVGAQKFAPDPSVAGASYYLQDPSLISNPSQPLGREGKQRGNSASKDQYFMVQFHMSIQLKTYKCPVNQSEWRTIY